MTKGSYPAADKRGNIVGRYVYDGDRWVYRPKPEPVEWFELAETAPSRESQP